MARSFIYDNIGLTESTLTDGTVSTTTFASSSLVTNEERAIDMSISTAITNLDLNDTLQFDVGEDNKDINADAIAIYFTVDQSTGNNLELYSSDDATVGTLIAELGGAAPYAGFPLGWNVYTFDVKNGRYWYLRSNTGTLSGVAEVIIGTKYTFDVNPELNAKTGEEFGTDIITSYGGNEYANKRHEPKTTWDWNWSHILSTQKTALENMNASVQDWKKFLYYDDTNYHYVRMTKPITFTEVAPSVYSANMSLREQLS